jgi:lysophospholipase
VSEAAPHIATDLAPAPEGGHAEWFHGADGARLRAALFPAKGAVRGSVVLSPGRTEPLDKYFEVIGELQARGFVVLAHDWRGQGLSARMLPDPLKGHAQGSGPFLCDYRILLDHFGDRLPKPWIQLGHSMGGCLSLLALAKGEERFSACALSAPMLGIVTSGYGYPLARGLGWAWANLGQGKQYLFRHFIDPMDLTFEGEKLAHDRGRWDRWRSQLEACPRLGVGNLTWGWLDFAFSTTAWLRRSKAVEAIDIPVLIVAAGQDDRVLTSDTARVARRLKNCRYVEIPDAWHEILMETDDIRAVWWREFDQLVAGVSPPMQAAKPRSGGGGAAAKPT